MLKEYFGVTVRVLTVAALALTLMHKKMDKVTRMAIGIVVICAIMSPFVDIIRENGLDFDWESELDYMDGEVNDEAIELAFEEGIGAYICDLYGISASCVKVNVDGLDMSKMRAERIYVTLLSEGMLVDYRALEYELIEEFTDGGECEVRLDA